MNNLAAKFVMTSPPSPLSQAGLGQDAAVLIACANIDNNWHLLLTQRASHLRYHPGQFAFPGGKRERHDSSLIATALRETEEEMGIGGQHLNVLGCLPVYSTLSGFRITPVVALLDGEPDFKLCRGEVDNAFYLPLNHLKTNRVYSQHLRKNTQQQFVWIPYQHRVIWGATAAILDEFCLHLEN